MHSFWPNSLQAPFVQNCVLSIVSFVGESSQGSTTTSRKKRTTERLLFSLRNNRCPQDTVNVSVFSLHNREDCALRETSPLLGSRKRILFFFHCQERKAKKRHWAELFRFKTRQGSCDTVNVVSQASKVLEGREEPYTRN